LAKFPARTSVPGMTSSEIRRSFLEFFRGKGHTIVPSSSLMPDAPNLLFTNAGMNQFVPVFLGERTCPYHPARAADTQKCIRAGGKHNDLEDVGFDTYHHTFFEMLGNWSFGDYFKAEAIGWAWKLVVERWGFPPSRLYATVYRPGPGDPSAFDSEAHDHWAALFTSAGLDPARHVVDGGRKDNFWMMGETGPCGPCSELHVDLTPAGDTGGSLVNAGDPQCIEIWNLVFIQFNAEADGGYSALPARHVDTGMGFERVVSILQGTNGLKDFSKGRISNYETDLFHPIFDEIGRLTGKRYGSSLPAAGETVTPGSPTADDIAFRVIADHLRALGFAIADGILPGNTDRNYVLRRILRRAVRYGRTLGLHRPFLHELAGVLASTMGDTFPEIRERTGHVRAILHAEEEAFLRTLDKGIGLFEAEASRGGGVIPGAFAFKLYDEQGFPLDLTQLMARERGMTVDEEGFERLMEAQRARARAARRQQVIELSAVAGRDPTHFTGFDCLEAEARVLECLDVKGRSALILDATPCYAEMGGQVGDTGVATHGAASWNITDTKKAGDTWLHFLGEGDPPGAGTTIHVGVDRTRRAAIERHHSATHLLHWALHQVVSRDATQKGSFVGPEKLTFDFNSPPLEPAQVRDLERLVNERILENAPVLWTDMPYDAIRDNPRIMQFFGEKYGDRVRVVQIGGKAGALDGYSMELCGGTHVRGTGQIGLFRIVSESAIAAGVRRIEAVAGLVAFEGAVRDSARLTSLAASLNSPVGDLEKKLETALDHARRIEKALQAALAREAAATAEDLLAGRDLCGDIPCIVAEVAGADGDRLQGIADALKGRFEGAVFLAGSPGPGQAAFVASVSPGFSKRVAAGRMVSTAASAAGGKGGGRPGAARGAGKDPSKIPVALEAARTEIMASAQSSRQVT
jgi:alanyl-tRNA synthetase